jgi:hypothetical protein
VGVGTSIVTRAGPSVRVLKIEEKHETALVYNFEVEGTHSYFVGKSQLWVHNVDCYDVDTYDELRKAAEVGDNMQHHHAPQFAPANRLGVPGYTKGNGPAIEITNAEHAAVTAAQFRNAAARNQMVPEDLAVDDLDLLLQHTNTPFSAINALRALQIGAGF